MSVQHHIRPQAIVSYLSPAFSSTKLSVPCGSPLALARLTVTLLSLSVSRLQCQPALQGEILASQLPRQRGQVLWCNTDQIFALPLPSLRDEGYLFQLKYSTGLESRVAEVL